MAHALQQWSPCLPQNGRRCAPRRGRAPCRHSRCRGIATPGRRKGKRGATGLGRRATLVSGGPPRRAPRRSWPPAAPSGGRRDSLRGPSLRSRTSRRDNPRRDPHHRWRDSRLRAKAGLSAAPAVVGASWDPSSSAPVGEGNPWSGGFLPIIQIGKERPARNGATQDTTTEKRREGKQAKRTKPRQAASEKHKAASGTGGESGEKARRAGPERRHTHPSNPSKCIIQTDGPALASVGGDPWALHAQARSTTLPTTIRISAVGESTDRSSPSSTSLNLVRM